MENLKVGFCFIIIFYFFFFLERVRFMKSIIRRRRAMPRKAAVALWNLGGENIKEMKDCTPREERGFSVTRAVGSCSSSAGTPPWCWHVAGGCSRTCYVGRGRWISNWEIRGLGCYIERPAPAGARRVRLHLPSAFSLSSCA